MAVPFLETKRLVSTNASIEHITHRTLCIRTDFIKKNAQNNVVDIDEH